MPDIKTHCAISKERTQGNEFRELHEWMDEPQKYFGTNHRLERHTLNDVYKKYVEERWKEKGVVEWLFHIALDNLETANKFAFNIYNKNFEEISVNFLGKELSGCKFIKKLPNSNKTFEIKLKEKIKEKLKSPEKEVRFTKEELKLIGFDDILIDQLSD